MGFFSTTSDMVVAGQERFVLKKYSVGTWWSAER